ncbi:MAG: class I SAM-dependent methyltransferase [Alphaproteobacteria bacterium]|nr:class I SAM-dependent methyltransferase [Alphaproteobacteria bacterium]
MFFSYVRFEMFVDPAGIGLDSAAPVTAEIVLAGAAPLQTVTCVPAGAAWAVTGEALVTPAAFPGDGRLDLRQAERVWSIHFATLLNLAAANQSHPLFPEFTGAVEAWCAEHPAGRPRMLDIGGRARSGVQRSEHFPACDVTTFDIVADPGVDVVGDAHEMSRHFLPESFDFALCIAVFEHLAMPWKVAVEMARVLKPGGLALIFTHQTIGMHDLPWDFFRFSDSAWSGLFNRYTGFEIVAARLTSFMHIVPRAWSERHRLAETAGGFEGSAVLVRRIGVPVVDWPVPLGEIIKTHYPTA